MGNTPISSIAAIATSPTEAKIFIAKLASEGIPAFSDGASLPDEFAMSQRMMNLSSVAVMVPTDTLERAKEILKPMEIDLDELTRQALSSEDEGGQEPRDTDSQDDS
jgi:hypothetical protein